MQHVSYAKIIATLGPSSNTPQKIEELFRAGADVFRLNFSHGTHEDHKKTFHTIRKLEERVERPIGIMVDLQGPKLRVGTFTKGEIELLTGRPFRLDMSPEDGDENRVNLPHPEIFKALKPGSKLLLNDGRIALRVDKCGPDFAETTVLVGGALSNRKGVNVPDVELPISALTEKDIADLKLGLELGADIIALSFVQRPKDVEYARELIGNKAWIVSKLEKPGAIDHLDEIIRLSDAIMVARGDLGVECPAERVPLLQKKIVNACRNKGRPVIVATQMLETMVSCPTPTRAEASDIATAVYDGADAVMLSAETASGDYPVQAVAMMDRIINAVEDDELYHVFMDASRREPEHTAADALTTAARQVAQTLKRTAAIVTYTISGSTTLRAARERPELPIMCLTPDINVARRMCLVWGVHSVESQAIEEFYDIEEKATRHALAYNLARPGQKLVITAGVPFGRAGTTNILRTVLIKPEQFPQFEPMVFDFDDDTL